MNEEEIRRLVVTLVGKVDQFTYSMDQVVETVNTVEDEANEMAEEVEKSSETVVDAIVAIEEEANTMAEEVETSSETVVDSIVTIEKESEKLAEKTTEASNSVQESFIKMKDPLEELKAEMEATFNKVDRDLESLKETSDGTTQNMEQGFDNIPPKIAKMFPFLKNVNLGLLSIKATMVLTVAKISWELGHAISDWIAGIEEWEKAHAKAVESIGKGQDFLLKKSQQRFDMDMKLAELAASPGERKGELAGLFARTRSAVVDQTSAVEIAEQELQAARENNTFGVYGMEDDALAESNLAREKEKLEVLKQQLEAVDRMANPRGRDAELARRKEELAAAKEKEAMERRAEAEELAKQAAQEDYLRSLEYELLKLQEGEEAYLARILTDQEFSKATIEKTLALRASIEAERASQQEAAANSQRAAQLLESLVTPQEKILQQALEIQELYEKGLIPEEALDPLMDNLQDQLDMVNESLVEVTEQASQFWKVLSGTSTEFGVGREGFISSLQDIRARAMSELDPNMSFNQARTFVTNESMRPGTQEQVDAKLLTVLELLENHLAKPNDPNEGAVKATRWDGSY